MANVTFEVKGIRELRAQLKMYPQDAHRRMCAELKREMDDIVEDSTTYVPIISGQLLQSRYVTPLVSLGNMQCMVEGGYSAPYALKVHEDATRASREAEMRQRNKYVQFGQWKYLEQPFLQATRGMVNRIARGMSGTRIGAVGRRG